MKTFPSSYKLLPTCCNLLPKRVGTLHKISFTKMTHLAPLFQSCPLSLFFSPTCLVNKACMSPFITRKQSGPFSQAATCISCLEFEQIPPKYTTRTHVATRNTGLLTNHHAAGTFRTRGMSNGSQKHTRSSHGKSRAGGAASPFAPQSCSIQGNQYVIKPLLPIRKSRQHLILTAHDILWVI